MGGVARGKKREKKEGLIGKPRLDGRIFRPALFSFSLSQAVDEEMERDPTVCLMGEDVGHYGGSYKVRRRKGGNMGD